MRRRGMTIVEALFGIVLFATLLGAVYVFMSGSVAQRRQLEDYLDLQHDIRDAMLRLQKDLRSVVRVVRLERGDEKRLERLEVELPATGTDFETVAYSFDPAKHALLRDNKVLVADSIDEVRCWLLGTDGSDVAEKPDMEGLQALRFRITISSRPDGAPGEGPGAGPTPATRADRQAANQTRTIDFTIFPRMLVAREKARAARMNPTTGRFALPDRATGPREFPRPSSGEGSGGE